MCSPLLCAPFVCEDDGVDVTGPPKASRNKGAYAEEVVGTISAMDTAFGSNADIVEASETSSASAVSRSNLWLFCIPLVVGGDLFTWKNNNVDSSKLQLKHSATI